MPITEENKIIWEFKCICGNELELPAGETSFSPTSLGLPECEECGEYMHHVGPILDECDRCGQALLYRGNNGLGRDTLCEGCYDTMSEMMGV